jgi:hypothetical protein
MADAELWAATIARAVATGMLSSQQAQATMRSLSEWRSAHEQGAVLQRLTELEKQVKRKEGKGKRR